MEAHLEQYRIFKTTAESESISSAAQKLFMTQSAVSQSIKNLEASLKTTLFIRTAKGISLTGEGEVLYSYVSSSLGLLEAGESRLSSFKTLDEGELCLAAGDTVSSYFLLPRLELFHKLYPKIKIKVINRVTSEAVELLKNGKIDLAFGNMPINDSSLNVRKCLEVHDVFVAGNGFDLLKDKVLTRRQISELPLILLEKKSNSRNYVDSRFLASGYSLCADIELGAHELLLQFAQINLGVSCGIKEFSKKYFDDGSVFEIKTDDPLPARHIGCITLKRLSLSAAAKKFMEYIPQL